MKKIFMVTLFCLINSATAVVAQIAVDKQSPDFILPDVNGENVKLSDLYGKGPILINFWATWCAPCLDEMKSMIPVWEKYHAQGFEMVSISVDDTKTAGRVPSFVNSRKYPFRILMDTNNEVMQLYQVTVPPFSVLLNKEGKIVYGHTGFRKGDEKKVEEKIAELLGAGEKTE